MLKKENYLRDCSFISKEIFAEKIALIKSELICLHPFYELNGRITRLFFDMIVVYNGYQPIDYSNYTSQEYINASIECVKYADETFMKRIILDGLKKA